jgi:phosphatidylglycerol:prolipoprotein diacylglycerol transferase
VAGLVGSLLGLIEIGVRPYWTISEPIALTLRWDAIAAGVTAVAAIVIAALLAHNADRPGTPRTLPAVQLIAIVIGIVPGAILGGRLVHGLAYLDVYAADPAALFDPARGTLSMLGAVIGGSLTGVIVAQALGTEWRRWLDIAAPTLLLTIAGAKFAQFVGGGGQGAAWDGSWAVAFVGAGPWTSPLPGVPAHPAQLYEAFWALAGLLIVAGIGSGRLRPGRLYLVALAWWFVGRFVIGFWWRDELVVGPLRAEQAMALIGLIVVAAPFIAGARRRNKTASRDREPEPVPSP